LTANACTSVTAIEAAVSSQAGELDFVRVLDNTTGSHLRGAKPNPYGRLETFRVRVHGVRDVLAGADLAKIDAEGHEKEILLATRPDDWNALDAVVEVGSPENAAAIHAHISQMGVGMFAQKQNWERVLHVESMPTSYRDGSLFVSRKNEMPWE
jgi:hypothetical protein